MGIKENQQEWLFDKKPGVGMAVNEGLAQVIHKQVFNKFKKQNLCQV